MEKTRALMTLLLVGWLAAACNISGEQPAATQPFATPSATATLRPPTNTPVPTSTPTTPTATPPPTNTLPPSDTPPPSPTPSPTLTPTPQLVGTVITESRVNVRSGPGVKFERIAVLNPGDTVLVIGPAEENQDWLEIVLPGENETGWILGNLVRVEERVLTETTTVAADTSTPAGDATPLPAVGSSENEAYVLANCDEFNRGRQSVRTGSTVFIYWGWVAATKEQLEQHRAHASYQITLNDRPIGDWRQITPVSRVEGGKPALYWYQWVGELPVGTYRVGYRVTWDAPITDGEMDYGPGTANEVLEFGCTFVVQ